MARRKAPEVHGMSAPTPRPTVWALALAAGALSLAFIAGLQVLRLIVWLLA